MDQPFKFRFVNEITGVFVLLCAAAMIVGVFLAGRAQGLFEPKLTLRTLLSAKEGSFGLREGTEVRILDTAAGTVKRVMPNASGQIEAVFVVKGSFHSFIRTSSKAVVKKKFAIAGDAYVEITAGDAKDPMLPDGGMIVCEKDTEIIGQIMKILEEAQQVAVESDLVTADLVEVTEFPHLAQRYRVRAVPRTVVNETTSIEGALPESEFVKAVVAAVRKS